MGALAPAATSAATSRAWYDELRLRGPFAAGLRETGLDEGAAWSVADLVGVLLALAAAVRTSAGLACLTADARLVDALAGRQRDPHGDRASTPGRAWNILGPRPVRDDPALGVALDATEPART